VRSNPLPAEQMCRGLPTACTRWSRKSVNEPAAISSRALVLVLSGALGGIERLVQRPGGAPPPPPIYAKVSAGIKRYSQQLSTQSAALVWWLEIQGETHDKRSVSVAPVPSGAIPPAPQRQLVTVLSWTIWSLTIWPKHHAMHGRCADAYKRAGYARDFVEVLGTAAAPTGRSAASKVISKCGGINPKPVPPPCRPP